MPPPVTNRLAVSRAATGTSSSSVATPSSTPWATAAPVWLLTITHTARSRSGTTRSTARWPNVSASWPRQVRSPQWRTVHPMACSSPGTGLSRWGCCIMSAAAGACQSPAQDAVEVLARHDLEEAAHHRVAGVAEAVGLVGGVDLPEAGQRGHVAGERVVVPSGIDEVVALEPARVHEEVPGRDLD